VVALRSLILATRPQLLPSSFCRSVGTSRRVRAIYAGSQSAVQDCHSPCSSRLRYGQPAELARGHADHLATRIQRSTARPSLSPPHAALGGLIRPVGARAPWPRPASEA